MICAACYLTVPVEFGFLMFMIDQRLKENTTPAPSYTTLPLADTR